MSKVEIDSILGFGGVHQDENSTAIKWANRLEAPMLLVALWILLEWYLHGKGMLGHQSRIVSDWFIWGFFFIETVILTFLCDHKLRYLRRNWANVFIIVFAFPLLFEMVQELGVLRMVRLMFMMGFFAHNITLVRNVLAQNHLGKTLAIAMVFITGGGILIATIDPAIDSPWKGIWWAWVTVTTVGYGDVVPSSPEGRVFASILMLVGIAMMSLITANISAYLLSRNVQKELRYEQRELKKLLQLEDRLELIEKKLDQLLEQKPKSEK